MNMYVVIAIFLVSSAIVIACLDQLKMRVARNLFLALTLLMLLYLPISLWGNDIVEFCVHHKNDNIVQATLAFVNKAIDVSNVAFASVTLLLNVLALIGSIATIIVIVQTAKVICKFVQKLQNKQPEEHKIPQKQNYQRKLVHTKIFYKRILYLRLCRLNS